jgi:predicted butyrate kinase (DUF1464 family)
MTKKDYELVAASIRIVANSYTSDEAKKVTGIIAEEIARNMAKANSKFDKVKFLKACAATVASKHPASFVRDASEDTQWLEDANG